jgi:regulation of enolase protein 1 (concanavalin A-like superfamily)
MIKQPIILSLMILLLVTNGTVVLSQSNPKPGTASLKSKAIPLASFKHRDIGNPSITGTVKIQENGINITAGGTDIWGVKDEFNFVYIECTGDFDLVSRIESLTAANLYTKAGLMAREDLTPGCRHIYFQVFSDNNARNKNNGGYEFQYRQVKDSSMKAIYPKTAGDVREFPVNYPNTWIRLQRVKNDFTGYYSIDGKTWKPYTTFTLDLPLKTYLGLAVTSHNPSHAVTAKFRNIGELKQ